MNRDIKFRAWDKKAKAIFLPSSSFLEGGLVALPDCEIMQYTGLKDKNGKEIYEGDIVKWQGENIIGKTKYTATGEVLFDRGCFIARTPEQGDDEGAYLWTLEDEDMRNKNLEVIGNIYENPELLEAR